MPALILIRGAGDLATGIALRLFRSHLSVVMTEIAQPLAVRRTVSFAEAVYEGEWVVEGVKAIRVTDLTQVEEIHQLLADNKIPVIVDPECKCADLLQPAVIIDARMTKTSPEALSSSPRLLIGLGPGFFAGKNCSVVIETRRGSALGRLYWQNAAESDTGLPDGDPRRILRATASGVFTSGHQIGEFVSSGQGLGTITNNSAGSTWSESVEITAPISGTLRGLLHSGLQVAPGMKVGDVDPRNEPGLCQLASDKALAIAGAALEAILSDTVLLTDLWK